MALIGRLETALERDDDRAVALKLLQRLADRGDLYHVSAVRISTLVGGSETTVSENRRVAAATAPREKRHVEPARLGRARAALGADTQGRRSLLTLVLALAVGGLVFLILWQTSGSPAVPGPVGAAVALLMLLLPFVRNVVRRP